MSVGNRYARQIILPEIGSEGQRKLSGAAVLCVGAGGLGCPALLYLAAAGIGRIGIIDFDTVDETNLQRQILFTVAQIGQNKAEAAKARLQELNLQITIESYPAALTDKNAEELFHHYDIIIDGTDNFAAKFLINDAAVKCNKTYIYGSILGFDGQLSVFNAPNGPCYRCLFPETPTGYVPNCAEAGVIGAMAGFLGTAQAMEVIKLIVGHENFHPLVGKLWTLDARTMESRILSLPKNPACPVCTKGKNEIMLKYTSPVCGTISEVTPRQARENKAALVLDVREKEEWDAGHIDHAQLVPLSALAQGHIPDIPRDSEIIIYCQKGKRGLQAAHILQAYGYIDVCNMAGGYEAWLECS